MLSNCMMSKTREITKIYRCAEFTDTLNTWRKRFIMIIIMLCYFEIFTICQRSVRTFSKLYSKCKMVLIKFITIQYFGDILGIFLKRKFAECFLNIDYWNLPKDQHLLLSNDTFLTQKQLFHHEFFKKSFPLKCFLNVLWMPQTMQRWRNTQGYSQNIGCQLGWVLCVQLCKYSNNFCLMQSFFQNISRCDRENTSLYKLPQRHMFYIKLFICIFLYKISFRANICFQYTFVVL